MENKVELFAKVLGVDEWTSFGNRGKLQIFEHPKYGRFVTGLFYMHDTEGFALTDSLFQCKKTGLTPCLRQFVADAILAGWTYDKAVRVVREALVDSMSPDSWWKIIDESHT